MLIPMKTAQEMRTNFGCCPHIPMAFGLQQLSSPEHDAKRIRITDFILFVTDMQVAETHRLGGTRSVASLKFWDDTEVVPPHYAAARRFCLTSVEVDRRRCVLSAFRL